MPPKKEPGERKKRVQGPWMCPVEQLALLRTGIAVSISSMESTTEILESNMGKQWPEQLQRAATEYGWPEKNLKKKGPEGQAWTVEQSKKVRVDCKRLWAQYLTLKRWCINVANPTYVKFLNQDLSTPSGTNKEDVMNFMKGVFWLLDEHKKKASAARRKAKRDAAAVTVEAATAAAVPPAPAPTPAAAPPQQPRPKRGKRTKSQEPEPLVAPTVADAAKEDLECLELLNVRRSLLFYSIQLPELTILFLNSGSGLTIQALFMNSIQESSPRVMINSRLMSQFRGLGGSYGCKIAMDVM